MRLASLTRSDQRRVEGIRSLAREAELSGMDQEAQRAYEIADVIESKANRDELLRIKSVGEPREPTQSELAAEYDRQAMESMSDGPRFDRTTYEADEARRIEAQNAQLAAANRQAEESYRGEVAQDEQPTPWWRR